VFPATRHSLVVEARSPDLQTRKRAYAALTAAYWKPVYKYLRLRWRASIEDAQDLTQSFFLADSTQRMMTRYESGRARFRTFLRTCLDGFVANERKAAVRIKRGGEAQFLSLELQEVESELQRQGSCDELDLEQYFHREWVRSLFGLAVDEFRAQASGSGKAVAFAIFERYDLGEHGEGERPTYTELGRQFGIPVSQVTNHLALARRRFREIILQKLEEITGSEQEFRDEARDLLGIEPR